VSATLKELQLAKIMFFHFLTICSDCVSAVVTVLCDIPCEGTVKWENSPMLIEFVGLDHL
jgi:hypothetical protein